MTHKRQQGFTLIELMIASMLGLIVIGGMYSMFTVNKELIRVQQNVGDAQQKAIFALELISEDIRMAGWPGVYSVDGTAPFGSVSHPAYPMFADNNNRYDTLVLSRMGRAPDVTSPNPLLQQGEMDCVGNIINFAAISEPLTHVYYVDPDTQELRCLSSISNDEQTIIGNVVGFQVLYGVDTVSGPCVNIIPGISAKDAQAECMTPTVFVNGNDLNATMQAAAAAFDGEQLSVIKAIRLGIVVATEENSIISSEQSLANGDFQIFEREFSHGSQGADFSDGRVNRFAVRTVALRQAFRGP